MSDVNLITMMRDASDTWREFAGVEWTDELDPDEKQELFATHLLGLFTEVGEVSECVGWKSWTANPGFVDDHLADELVDVIRFVLNVGSIAGLSGLDLRNAWLRNERKMRERLDDEYLQRRRDGEVESESSVRD